MWNAELYERFNKERIQPSVDLISRLDDEYLTILDVGCGTGMSSFALRNHYPNACIIGVDKSDEMLEGAKKLDIDVQWVRKDCSKSIEKLGVFDMIFSNAFMHWLPDQEKFIKEIRNNMHSESVLAIQIPLFSSMKVSEIIDKIAGEYGTGIFGDIQTCTYHSIQEYYDMFSQYYDDLTLWQTDYIHQFDTSDKIVDFVKGTALIPYLEKLTDDGKIVFLEEIQKYVKENYPVSKNGQVLFRFKRLFLIAKKPLDFRDLS